MIPLMNSRGEMVDMTTGKIVGRAEGTPTAIAPREPAATDIETQGGDRAMGLVNNLSWGFNSALFALPDLATKGIGKAMGLKDEEVFTLGKFFNQGQVSPRNAEERYSRAIGEGVGATMPFTGILAHAARVRPMVTVAQPSAGILRGIANDAIKFAQAKPLLAATVDVAFGAGYETLRQAVKENVSDDNPNKKLYEELLPMGAFVGLPVAVSFMPAAVAGKFVGNKIKGATSGLGDVENDVLKSLGSVYQLPGIRIAPKLLIKNAERKLAQVFGPIEKSPEAQEALRQLEAALTDPRFAQAGFMFDAAEKTMYSPLLERKAELLQQLGPAELEATKLRINENQQKLSALFDSISPQARQPVIDAFQAAQAERQSFFESLLKNQKDMTEAEILAVSERLGPQNMDMVNNELRGALLAAMEFDANMRTNTLNRMGLRQATSPEGLPMPTREEGKSLFPSQDMTEAATSLIAKYTPERPSLRTPVPEPIAVLRNFVQKQQIAKDKMEDQMVKQLTTQSMDQQIAASNMGAMLKSANSEVSGSAQKAIDSVKFIFNLLVKQQRAGKKLSQKEMSILKAEQGYGTKMTPEGEVSIKVGADTFKINPKQLVSDANLIAKENTAIDINLPEALDYLAAAARFRNDALVRYNAAMGKGGTRLTDAQRYLDQGNAVYNDVEKLILGHVPKIQAEYEGMKNVLSDYRAGYEQSLPLLMSQKKGRGEEFLLGNEQLMQKAFSSAENLRQLQVSMAGTPQFDELLMKGTTDWLRTKGVVNAEGIVDPKKIRQVLDKNKNIVEALPGNVQQKLQNEVALADDYVKRLGELDQRRIAVKDEELDKMLRKVGRPDADPRETIAAALKDPATMRVLVNEFSKDPERLAALRRAVFDIAGEGTAGGGALQAMLAGNEKSLKVLFGGTTHLEDLKKLADMQRRVNAFADITGQIPVFQSLDETLKRVFGSGIQFLTTTAREAAVGRISPSTGALAIMVRLSAGLENNIYKRLFTRALEDPQFAARITSVATPAQGKQLVAQLQQIGIPSSKLLPNAARIANQEAAELALEGQQVPTSAAGLPVMSQETARSMMRALPPSVPTVGAGPNFRTATTPPRPPGGGVGSVPLMYPALFPNDPISGMLQQRQQQLLERK